MIRSWRHKGIRLFFETGSKKGIQPKHAETLRQQLFVLDHASRPEDMKVPGWNLHALKGDQAGRFSVWVDENWRLTFAFDGTDAILVDYHDYH